MDISSSFLSFSLLAFFSFFAVLGPINFTIIFLSLTSGASPAKKKRIANVALAVSFSAIIVSMLLGEYIFRFLQIEMYSFRIAGGLLLAMSGIHMIFGQNIESPSKEQLQEAKEDNDTIAIFPLAMPLLAGPGALSNAIILFAQYSSLIPKLIVILAVVANYAILVILLRLSSLLAKHIKEVVLNILYRTFGLLVGSLGVDICIKGIKASGLFN